VPGRRWDAHVRDQASVRLSITRNIAARSCLSCHSQLADRLGEQNRSATDQRERLATHVPRPVLLPFTRRPRCRVRVESSHPRCRGHTALTPSQRYPRLGTRWDILHSACLLARHGDRQQHAGGSAIPLFSSDLGRPMGTSGGVLMVCSLRLIPTCRLRRCITMWCCSKDGVSL
jgi:hypothetical protein